MQLMSRRILHRRPTGLGDSGSVAIQTALMLIALLGFVALGVEISDMLMLHRQQQAATDSAAMAAASTLATSDPQAEALAVTAELGFKNGTGGVSVGVASPPASGTHAGDANYVEVTVQQPVTPVLTSLIHAAPFTLATRAVGVRALGVAACGLALDTSASNAVQISNNVTLTVSSCGLAVNSSSNSALSLGNGSEIDGPVSVVGGVQKATSAKITGGVTTASSTATDPYASIALPSKPAQQLTASSGSATLSPGWYPNGWSFGNGATINLQAGVYWIDTQLNFGNNTTITGQGVTLILGDFAMNSGNGANLNLTAPTSGATAGMVFYSAASNSSSRTQIFSNNTVLNTTGVLYFPSQAVQFSNNVVTGVSACTQVVARIIQIQNSVTFNANCSGVAVATLGSKSAAGLVE